MSGGLVFAISKDKDFNDYWYDDLVADMMQGIADWVADADTTLEEDIQWCIKEVYPDVVVLGNRIELPKAVLDKYRKQIAAERKARILELLNEPLDKINWWGIREVVSPTYGTYVCFEQDAPIEIEDFILTVDPGIYYITRVFDYHC